MDPNKKSSSTGESNDDLGFLLAEVNKALQEIERLLADAEEKEGHT